MGMHTEEKEIGMAFLRNIEGSWNEFETWITFLRSPHVAIWKWKFQKNFEAGLGKLLPQRKFTAV